MNEKTRNKTSHRNDGWKENAGELYTSGWTMQKIADKYGCSRQRIHQILKRAGVKGRSYTERKKPHLDFSPTSDKGVKLLDMYHNIKPVYSNDQIVEEFGFTDGHKITRWMNRHGLPVRNPYLFISLLNQQRGHGKEKKERILHDYIHADMTVNEIAEHHGIAQNTIYEWLRETKIQKRSRGGNDKRRRQHKLNTTNQ